MVITAPLHVYAFDYDWFVAHSEDDALKVFREHYVTQTNAIDDAECDSQLASGCTELPDDQPLAIICDEKGAISDLGEAVYKPCGAWAKENGRGFLCSTEI